MADDQKKDGDVNPPPQYPPPGPGGPPPQPRPVLAPVSSPSPWRALGNAIGNGLLELVTRVFGHWRSTVLFGLGGAALILTGLQQGKSPLAIAIGVITALSGALSKDS